LRKRRHEAINISVVLDDGEDDMIEKAALDAEQAAVTDKSNGDLSMDADDGDTSDVAMPPAILFNVNNNAVAIADNNHPQRTIEQLQEQVTQLENTVVQLQKSECRWRKNTTICCRMHFYSVDLR